MTIERLQKEMLKYHIAYELTHLYDILKKTQYANSGDQQFSQLNDPNLLHGIWSITRDPGPFLIEGTTWTLRTTTHGLLLLDDEQPILQEIEMIQPIYPTAASEVFVRYRDMQHDDEKPEPSELAIPNDPKSMRILIDPLSKETTIDEETITGQNIQHLFSSLQQDTSILVRLRKEMLREIFTFIHGNDVRNATITPDWPNFRE